MIINQVEAGTDDLSFDHGTYAHKDVKQRLVADQNGKCAYCEQSLNGDYGDVEHYRPKAGYCANNGEKLVKPGYYWLAYDWGNLLLSCTKCNRSYKKNLFPVLDESTRDVLHREVGKERPLLINPSVDEPGEHICFERFVVKPKTIDEQVDPIGQTTIETFQLNDRADLVDRRRQRWEEYDTLRLLMRAIKLCPDLFTAEEVRVASDIFGRMQSDVAEFAGMFKYQI